MTRRHVYIPLALLLIASLLAWGGPAFAQSDDDTPRLIAPSGPYQVGRTAYQWLDETRGEAHTSDPDDVRELLVEVWYPADPDPDAALAPYLEAPMAERLALALEADPGKVAGIQSNSVVGAPLAAAQDTYPVVVFDPGYSVFPRRYTALLEEFASFGYVVAAVYHPYTTELTVMPDGRVIEAVDKVFFADLDADHPPTDPEFSHVWVPDTTFVLDQIEMLNTDDPQGLFTGRLDLDRGMGMVGHSQGGRTVTEVCLLDARCVAAINIDGSRSAYADLELDKPYLMVLADDGVDAFVALFERGFEGMNDDFYVIMIPGSTHGSSYDYPFSVPLVTGQEPSDTLRIAQITLVDYRVYFRAFLDRYVKGEDVPLFDGPSNQFPEVFFLRRDEPIAGATAGVKPQPAAPGPNMGTVDLGSADIWTYEGQAGETLNVLVFAERPAHNTDQEQRREHNLMDTLLVIRNPDGSFLTANDDVQGGITDSSVMGLTLPEDGTYLMIVRTWQSDTAGNYTLMIDSDRHQD